MAAIVQSQQSQNVQEESAARQFWQSKMQQHPNIAGGLAIVSEVAGFFLNGHFLVKLGQWMIRVAGYVAETALLFAVLWISGTSVAPQLVELVMSEKTMQNLVSVALIVLALIPEIILANAIINAVGHWLIVARDHHSIMAWVWALAFTIPTLLFLYLTAYTLNRLSANNGNFVQAGAGMIGLRCFAGWTYGLLEMVYAGVGRKMVSQAQAIVTSAAQSAPAQQIDYAEIARQLLPLVAQEVRQAISDTTDMVEQFQQLRTTVEELTVKSAPVIAPTGALENTQACEEEGTESTTEPTPIDDTESLTEERGQERNTITLMSAARSAHTRSKPHTANRSEKARKAASIIKRNPHISAPDLAKKAQISTSYARKLLVNQ